MTDRDAWGHISNYAWMIAAICSASALMLWPDDVDRLLWAMYSGLLFGVAMFLGWVTSEIMRGRRP